jgi:tetratricopeptide (TPR) repeat protein
MSTYGVPQSAWYDSAIRNADYSIKLDATAPDGYLVKGRIHGYLGNISTSDNELEKAYALAPNNPEVLQAYGYLLLRLEKEEGADLVLKGAKDQYSPRDPEYYSSLTNAYFLSGDLKTMEELLIQAKSLNPGAIEPYFNLSFVYNVKGEHDKALDELKAAEKINPDMPWICDAQAWTYFKKKDYATAAQYWGMYPHFESKYTDTTQTIPFRHRLAMTYAKMGRRKEGDKLVQEDIKIRKGLLEKTRGMGNWSNFGSVYYDLAVDYAYQGNEALAVQCLDSAFHYLFNYYEGYDKDPAFENLKNREDFKKVITKRGDHYKFLQKAFSNSLNRAQAGKELKGLREK